MNLINGIPTKIEVDKLMNLAAHLKEGDILPYSAIQRTTGLDRKSNRGLAVLTAFRKRIYRERNILLTAAKNEGLRFANPVERVEVAASGVIQGRRKIIRAAIIASSTSEAGLDDEQRKTRSHISTLPNRLKLAQLTAPKSFSELT